MNQERKAQLAEEYGLLWPSVISEFEFALMDRLSTDRERHFLSSVHPDCHNGILKVLAFCEKCGTVQVFDSSERSRFPDSGLWTECRACAKWRHFYRLHDGRVINTSFSGKES